MKVLACFASLLAVSLATLPEFTFKTGTCPTVPPSTNFNANDILGKKFYVQAHTDKKEHDGGCCSCAFIEYEMKDGFLESHRQGWKNNGDKVDTFSKFVPVEGASGKYTYYFKNGNDWVNTGLTVTFNYKDNYLSTFGCVQKDDKFGDVAIISSTDEALNESKLSEMKTYLQNHGFSGTYYNVAHNNCQH